MSAKGTLNVIFPEHQFRLAVVPRGQTLPAHRMAAAEDAGLLPCREAQGAAQGPRSWLMCKGVALK